MIRTCCNDCKTDPAEVITASRLVLMVELLQRMAVVLPTREAQTQPPGRGG